MKIGFIDYYLDEWHANHYPQMIKDQSNSSMEVCYAYGKISSPHTGKTNEEWCIEHNIEYCDTIEILVKKSDAILVLAPDNCEMHEELAAPALKSGKCTFIDKTFAPSKKAAESIFRLADQYQTPCYSTSSLRFADEYQPYIGQDILSATFLGPKDLDVYSVHLLEPIVMLMRGCAKRVLVLKKGGWNQAILDWEDGRVVSMVCTGTSADYCSHLCVNGRCENIEVHSNFFKVFIDELIRFFNSRQVPVACEETISIMAMREAIIKAAEHPGEWVAVYE